MSRTNSRDLIAPFAEACNYPGKLDEREVEKHLALYLESLGIDRKVVRLRQGWTLSEHPSLSKYVFEVMEKIRPSARDALAARDARDARDALAARDARDARAALAIHRFAAWCIQCNVWWGWWGGRFDLSWIACTYIGALQLDNSAVERWSKPLYDAFLAGCWFLHFTEDTVFWVAKPVVHIERSEGFRRLHCDQYAALESDVENLYFWHGVMVPAFVVVRPDWITTKHILSEENAEVRRVMMERFDEVKGKGAFIQKCGAKVIDSAVQPMRPGEPDAINELLAIDLPDDPDGRYVALKVIDPSTGRQYVIRVPPDQSTVKGALAWSFDVPEEKYKLVQES